MAKKEKAKRKKKEEEAKEELGPKNERGGFPEDIDFKKFLGCGG